MPTLATHFQHIIESPSQSNEVRKRNKTHPNWKEVKLLLFADDMILCAENPKDSTKKLLEVINKYNKVARYKINI